MQESLDASLVRIRTVDGRVVGAGFLVGERQVMTCAHVVVQALGLSDHPADAPQGLVSLDFPLVAPRTLLTARVVLWCPALSEGSGDIAGLELQSEPPAGAKVVHFAPAGDVWEHPFRAFGFPVGFDDGVWATGHMLGRQATGWVMIEDVKAQGHGVVPGFSGTPVWDMQAKGVVGMVVAASRPVDTKAAFVIPLDVLVVAWPLITVPQGEPRNPYKGLRLFTQKDAGDFFGREPVVEKLVEVVKAFVTEKPASASKRLLTIIGPSGSGKSSVIMAGLLPRLQQGVLPGSKEWVYLDPILPGQHPIEALASTLKPHFPDTSFKTLLEDLEDHAARGLHLLAMQQAKQRGTRVVLLIDQFEELFTQAESEDERQRFIQLLLTACSEPRGPLVVLLTLRADFYDRPMQYPDLFRLIDTQHLSLLSMDPDNLRRVIEQPAALSDVQVAFEGDLVLRLLSEVQGQVGALPLLQFTLDQLFEQRRGHTLTLAAYHEMGGVKGALTRHAEATYAALPSEEHRKLARAVFLRLLEPGASEQDTTRRRAALSEFSLDDPTRTRLLRETIDAFIAARLLTTNEVAGTTTIEVSHEALIREWTRLSAWLLEARQDILLQQTISKDVAEWERRGKPKDRLYRGSQLKEVRIWARRNTLSRQEMAFLRASTAHRRQHRINITAIVLLSALVTGLAGQLLLITRPPWCPAFLCAAPKLVLNQHGVHDDNLEMYFTTFQSALYVIPGDPTHFSPRNLPDETHSDSIGAQSIDERTLTSPYRIVLGVHSLQEGGYGLIIEKVVLVIDNVPPVPRPLNVLVKGAPFDYHSNPYKVVYNGQGAGAVLAATYLSSAYTHPQLKAGEADELAIQVASHISVFLQFHIQITYRIANKSQMHTLELPEKPFSVIFFSQASDWHAYQLQNGYLVTGP